MKQRTVSEYLSEKFGCKVYKLSLDCGFTCPNRDGTIGVGGCIFCSESGGGDFAESGCRDIDVALDLAKKRVEAKAKGGKYIAYFQAFSNTYAPVGRLRELYMKAVCRDDIVGLSIATRPDCVGDEVIKLLSEINEIKPVTVELGLQSSKDETGEYIKRGYSTAVFDDMARRLHAAGIETVAHMIIGLPTDSKADMIATARHISDLGIDGIKFHLLHILKNTPLEKEYLEGKIKVLSLDEYTDILLDCISALREDIIIHRLTGDGSKKELVAPLWSADKKRVLNHINRALERI